MSADKYRSRYGYVMIHVHIHMYALTRSNVCNMYVHSNTRAVSDFTIQCMILSSSSSIV